MPREVLTDDNFLIYCARHYQKNFYYTTEEFMDDLNRITYVKKLITRYIESGVLKERLMLNHIIIINNTFGPGPSNKILYLKLKQYMSIIKPFLIYLNVLQDTIYNVNDEKIIYMDQIPMDFNVVEKLRKI